MKKSHNIPIGDLITFNVFMESIFSFLKHSGGIDHMLKTGLFTNPCKNEFYSQIEATWKKIYYKIDDFQLEVVEVTNARQKEVNHARSNESQ